MSIIIFILIGLGSCSQKTGTALLYNNTAMHLMVRNPSNHDTLQRCVILVDSAISIEPENWIYYHNKWMFLYKLGMFDSALKTALKAFAFDSINYRLSLDAAITMDTLRNKDSATFFYNKSLVLLDKTSLDKPQTILANDYQKIIVYMLLQKNNEYIQNAIKDFKNKYQDSSNIDALVFQLNSFNKEVYMASQ